MTQLDADFEEKLARAVLPDEDEMREHAKDLEAKANANWAAYMAANDYDLEHITDGSEVRDVRVGRRRASARVTWPFSSLFEWGVDPHVIEASSADTLQFEWPAPPEGTRPQGAPPFVNAESVDWGSVTGGIPEARAIRTGLLEWRGERRR